MDHTHPHYASKPSPFSMVQLSATMSASDVNWPAHMTHSMLSSVSDLHSARPTMCTLLRRAGVPLCRPMTVAETCTSTCICSNHSVRLLCIHQDTFSLPLQTPVCLLCSLEVDAAGQRGYYVSYIYCRARYGMYHMFSAMAQYRLGKDHRSCCMQEYGMHHISLPCLRSQMDRMREQKDCQHTCMPLELPVSGMLMLKDVL